AILRVLEEVGMHLQHDEAMALLKAAGCRVDDEGKVRVPRRLVENAIRTAPKNIPIFDREGRQVMDLGGRRSYFGTGSDLIYRWEAETNQRHHTKLDDIVSAARVCDALPNIDFIMSFAHPNDITPKRSYLESFWAMAANSTKPIVNTAEGRHDLETMWEISKILRGGEKELRAKPYWIQYDEPISPLKHPFASVDKLIFCARTGSPVIYSPAPIAGSTAPMTVAGHIVQGLAESFFGLVIHQLTVEGAPFLMGVGAAVLDMITAQCSYNAPEYLMTYLAVVEMHHHVGLPNWGYAGTSDAQIPDQQAALEASLLTYMSTIAGSNLNHDVGYLDFGRTGALEMIVIQDEVIDQIRRMQKGVPINDDTLAVKVIEEGGRHGHFLSHPHTIKHLRGTQWRPKLLCRQGFEKWEENGRTSLLDRARNKVRDILAKHKPIPVAEEKIRQIEKVLADFQV
ncbi:MAG: trimethylamine methyltransferase family protein, partial [Deltaproteobacteria bacterium]|nr:trimethylamine methyltransferase family protein [Deltaproteobacteria bacterium]